jgi:hypothetical protein
MRLRIGNVIANVWRARMNENTTNNDNNRKEKRRKEKSEDGFVP